MAAGVEFLSLPLPPSADASKFENFGKEVKGIDLGNLTPETFKTIEEALYKVRLMLAMFASALVADE